MHYDDPLGLFADKLGRALALQRQGDDGRQLYPVFHHIHHLGQTNALKKIGRFCPLNHGADTLAASHKCADLYSGIAQV